MEGKIYSTYLHGAGVDPVAPVPASLLDALIVVGERLVEGDVHWFNLYVCHFVSLAGISFPFFSKYLAAMVFNRVMSLYNIHEENTRVSLSPKLGHMFLSSNMSLVVQVYLLRNE